MSRNDSHISVHQKSPKLENFHLIFFLLLELKEKKLTLLILLSFFIFYFKKTKIKAKLQHKKKAEVYKEATMIDQI